MTSKFIAPGMSVVDTKSGVRYAHDEWVGKNATVKNDRQRTKAGSGSTVSVLSLWEGPHGVYVRARRHMDGACVTLNPANLMSNMWGPVEPREVDAPAVGGPAVEAPTPTTPGRIVPNPSHFVGEEQSLRRALADTASANQKMLEELNTMRVWLGHMIDASAELFKHAGVTPREVIASTSRPDAHKVLASALINARDIIARYAPD